jgi:diketogulonate reductase-like aldo/keto reductase
MLWKELGTTGVSIPEIGMGTSNYRAGPEPLRRGLQAGAQFIDTAESYGTEPTVANAIYGVGERVFLATKVSPQNFRSDALRRSVESCLLRLRVDAIDLLQLHAPNPSIPLEETLGAMAAMVDAGKVRFIGVSNFSVAQLQEAQKASTKYPVVSNQVRYNIIDRTIEKDLLSYCRANRITIIAYSPLAHGLEHIRDCDPKQSIDRLAREIGKTSAQIALNWCLCKEGVVAIPKSNSAAHIIENCGASDWRLGAEQLTLLDTSILHRRRTRFDVMIRRYTPVPIKKIGLRLLNHLRSGLRRRIN